MNYAEWLDTIEPLVTPKGARLDLRFYVYPDQHGNIHVESSDAPGQPVGNLEQALQIVRDLWHKASHAHDGSDSPAREEELTRLLAQVTPENVHREIDLGAPVGREVW